MTRVYSAQNSLMVDHLKLALDARGIDCVVRNRILSSMAGRLPPQECWIELWVLDDAQSSEARQIIEQAFQQEAPMSGTWQCPRCGEWLEPQFEACWKCSTLRGASPEEGLIDQLSPTILPTLEARSLSPEMRLWIVLGLMVVAVIYLFRSYAG